MTNNDSLTTVGSGDNSISCAVGHPSANTIVFISDLHFDYTAGKYRPSDAAKRQQAFMDFIKGYYSNCVLCLAGDYYDNYQETLSFIKELEENRIVGFFVLGNHDYWNDRTRSHDDIIRIFNSETRNNNYFRFLVAGKKFYINDVCVIGDTGWTSFISKSHDVSLEQFMSLPDVNKVRGFQPKKIREGHDKWIAYANRILSSEKKVLIVTHYPMLDFTHKPWDCWWSSETKLAKLDNYWCIFGHTHYANHAPKRENNHISSQQGYRNYSIRLLEQRGIKHYSPQSFGILQRVVNYGELTVSSTEALLPFYSPSVISKAATDNSLI
jgi:predicted phosphohydrolase